MDRIESLAHDNKILEENYRASLNEGNEEILDRLRSVENQLK